MSKYYDIYDETPKALAGYGAQLMIYNPDVSAFTLLIPLEEVPTVVGSVETFEINLLTSNSKGSISGKRDVENATTDFIWHRDNVLRLTELSGKQHDMLLIYPDSTGWKFTGSITYTPNAAGAEVFKGTLTITPSTIGEYALNNVKPLCKKTCFNTTTINSQELVSKASPKTFNLTATSENAVWQASSTNEDITVSVSTNQLTITATGAAIEDNAIITLTCSLADKSMASWTTTFMVVVEA